MFFVSLELRQDTRTETAMTIHRVAPNVDLFLPRSFATDDTIEQNVESHDEQETSRRARGAVGRDDSYDVAREGVRTW